MTLPPPGPSQPKSESCVDRFRKSMIVGYEQWHDGTGYDLDILKSAPPEELAEIENLLLARVSDLSLKVMLENRFGEPGQLVSLSREFVAFPNELLPEIKSCLKKSGHVVKSLNSDEVSAENSKT